MIAISADNVSEAAQMRDRYGFEMILLADESLSVIDRYGLRHDGNMTPVCGPFRSLAVPTTVLIGADGIVKWIDRSTDYRTRLGPDRLLI